MLTDLDVIRQLRNFIYNEGRRFIKAKAISWNQKQTVFRICFRVREHRRNLNVDLKEINTGYSILATGKKVFFTDISLKIPDGEKEKIIVYWRLTKD